MKLEKFGEYYLNPEQITEVEVIGESATFYLSDGRKRNISVQELQEFLVDNKIEGKEAPSREYVSAKDSV